MTDVDQSDIPRNVGPGDQIVPEDETFGTPDLDEVFQEDDSKPDTPPLPVLVVGGKITGIRTFSVSTTVPQRILNADPRRTSWTIIPLDNDILLGNTQEISSGTGTLLPAGVPLTMNTSDEIWAMADSVTALVSVFFELWAR